MLLRKKKFYQDVSFVVDVIVGFILLQILYFILDCFGPRIEAACSWLTGYPFSFQGMSHLTYNDWLFSVIMLCLFLSLWLNRFYALDLFVSKTRIIIASVKSNLVGLGFTTLFFYVVSNHSINRSLLFGFFITFTLFQIGKEITYRWLLIRQKFKRHPMRGMLVCAPEQVSERLAEVQHHELKSVTIDCVCLTRGSIDDLPEDWRERFVGTIEQLSAALSRYAPEVVLLNDRGHARLSAQRVIEVAEEQGVEVWYFAEFLEPLLARPEFDEFGGEPVIIFSTVPHYEGRFLFKRCLDITGALIFLFLLSPLMLCVMLAIQWESRGKGTIIYRQQRTGWRGKTFTIYKFRTMYDDADEQLQGLVDRNEMHGPIFKLNSDPRVTKLGKWLRRFSIDEVPQLWNVLRGEMSLVGPRPLPIRETERFEVFRDRRRLSVLPGITGLWQVSGRNNLTSFADWVRLDLEYIDQWSFWLDLRILVMTIPVVLTGQGAL